MRDAPGISGSIDLVAVLHVDAPRDDLDVVVVVVIAGRGRTDSERTGQMGCGDLVGGTSVGRVRAVEHLGVPEVAEVQPHSHVGSDGLDVLDHRGGVDLGLGFHGGMSGCGLPRHVLDDVGRRLDSPVGSDTALPEERTVAGALWVMAGCRAWTGNGGPCHTSLTSMPRPTSSLWAASMSETINAPSAEPGAAVVIPMPNVIEHAEPGGVNWTMRRPSSGATSSSRCRPSAEPGSAELTPVPKMIEADEPGGASCTTLKSPSE